MKTEEIIAKLDRLRADLMQTNEVLFCMFSDSPPEQRARLAEIYRSRTNQLHDQIALANPNPVAAKNWLESVDRMQGELDRWAESAKQELASQRKPR